MIRRSGLKQMISVVMSVYNAEDFLQQALDSILQQRGVEIELIVVDDGSTDRSAEILEACRDPRLKTINNKQNIGQTKSLNLGLELARGDLIARHDADDISEPTRLKRQSDYMLSHPSLALLGSDYEIIDRDGQVLETVRIPPSDHALKDRLATGNIFCHGSVMFRASLVQAVGGYREEFPVTQDFDLWLRISEQFEIASLPQPLYQFRFQKDAVSRRSRARQLAYKGLALELARQRISTGSEQPLPDDVMATFPPREADLVRAKRGSAYLYFLSGDLLLASESMQDAGRLSQAAQINGSGWARWIHGRALTIAEHKKDVEAGAGFIRWSANMLAPLVPRISQRSLLGQFYASCAYRLGATSEAGRTRVAALKAVCYEPSWLLDRGFWKACLLRWAPSPG